MKRIQESQSLAATNADNKLDKFIYDQQTHFDRLGSLLLRSTGIGQLVSLCCWFILRHLTNVQ